MKTKIKNYLFSALATILFLIANVFPVGIVQLLCNADGAERFGAIQLYSTYTTTETVQFSTRSDDLYETINGVPQYVAQSNLTNSCGATAGAIIVGFYDKYYDNLIPGYTSYYTANGRYRMADKVYIPALMEELYGLMKTSSAGVTESNCLSGLRQYVQNHSQSISYSSVKSSSAIDETAYLNSINANKPVIIFTTGIELISGISTDTGYDTISKMDFTGNHVFVGYGYYRVKYSENGKVVRTDTYMNVACGLSTMKTGYIRLSSTATSVSQSGLVNAYSVSVS